MPPRASKKKASSKKRSATVEDVDKPMFSDHNPQYYHSGGSETVRVIEEYFAQDAHLSHAVKYMCRAGKKPESSYTKDVGKAAWWLVRALIFHRGLTDIQGVIQLMRREGVLKDRS